MKMLDWLVDLWLRRCCHHGSNVAADILEADEPTLSVAYCRRCGAVQVRRAMRCLEWRRPRPLWHPTGGAE